MLNLNRIMLENFHSAFSAVSTSAVLKKDKNVLDFEVIRK